MERILHTLLATVVEGDSKAPFSIATTPRCTGSLANTQLIRLEQSIRQWSGRPGFNPWSSHTEDSKMLLDSALFNSLHYMVRIKGNVE